MAEAARSVRLVLRMPAADVLSAEGPDDVACHELRELRAAWLGALGEHEETRRLRVHLGRISVVKEVLQFRRLLLARLSLLSPQALG